MIRRDIINVVGDLEAFIDRLLPHTEEENCQHSISDFLQEYFENKNKIRIGVGRPDTSSNNQQTQQQPEHPRATEDEMT